MASPNAAMNARVGARFCPTQPTPSPAAQAAPPPRCPIPAGVRPWAWPHFTGGKLRVWVCWSPGQSPELSSPDPYHPPGLPDPDSSGPSAPPGIAEPPTFTRNATVLLTLLLRVEFVAIALAAPIDEADALPLDGIKRPELDVGSARPRDYGEVTGLCRVGRRQRALENLVIADLRPPAGTLSPGTPRPLPID